MVVAVAVYFRCGLKYFRMAKELNKLSYFEKLDFDIYLKVSDKKSVKVRIELKKYCDYFHKLEPFNEPKIHFLILHQWGKTAIYRKYQFVCLN